jgi:hypothetical protein
LWRRRVVREKRGEWGEGTEEKGERENNHH